MFMSEELHVNKLSGIPPSTPLSRAFDKQEGLFFWVPLSHLEDL
jgi:hypothetical protein